VNTGNTHGQKEITHVHQGMCSRILMAELIVTMGKNWNGK
jgi:hypothetical protein